MKRSEFLVTVLGALDAFTLEWMAEYFLEELRRVHATGSPRGLTLADRRLLRRAGLTRKVYRKARGPHVICSVELTPLGLRLLNDGQGVDEMNGHAPRGLQTTPHEGRSVPHASQRVIEQKGGENKR